MESDIHREQADLQALIGLRREEERRLQGIVSDPTTSPEVKSSCQIALERVRRDIQADEDELKIL